MSAEPDSSLNSSLVGGATLFPSALRPALGVEAREQRSAIEAALFGVNHEAPLIGRYRLLERLGSGGMGTVYAAYDDRLDRKIAVKLIHTRRSGDDEVRQRTLREARVLARLSHPNVVHVYEVGELEGELFVAMEFMAGPTLRGWLDARPERSWQEVLGVMSQAGEGLAAAHAIGIVHRDFKPHNAMLGADGRVRVLDFGLAGFAACDDESLAGATIDSALGSDSSSSSVTRPGTLMGTPAYMAPEQFAGKPADARSDQFGFCVALYEALYGQRPFVGGTITQLMEAVQAGNIAAPPSGTRVPAWLRKVVLRGLSTDPARRFASMRALLDALADDPAVRRRNWGLATLTVGVFATLLWGASSSRAPELGVCEGMDAKLVGVWDDARRSAVEAAMLGSGSSFAAGTWPRVAALLDVYAQQWVTGRSEACQATARAEQSGELLDRRMACLDARLVAMRATVDVLAEADASVVEQAVELVSALPQLDRCADIEALQAEHPPPEDPALARAVAKLEDRLAAAWALTQAGKLQDALTQAEATLAEVEPLAWQPLTVRTLVLVGRLQDMLQHDDQGRAVLERAYRLALEQRMLAEAAEAAIRLLGRDVQADEARPWIIHAEALALASHDRSVQANYWRERAGFERGVGNDDEARVALDRALTMMIEQRGAEHPDVAVLLNNLGALARETEQLDEARSLFERALALEQASLGPGHPQVATTLTNLGNIALLQGKYDEAGGLHRRALDVARAAFGTDHLTTALVLGNLANLAHAEGKRDEARAYDQQVLEIRERVLGPDHPIVALALINVGADALEGGDVEAARGSFERALAIQEQTVGPTHRQTGLTLINLAALDVDSGALEQAQARSERAHALFSAISTQHPLVAEAERLLGTIAQQRGRHDEALARFESALAILEAAVGPEHPDLLGVLLSLGDARLEFGQPADALALLERALALCEQHGGFVGDRAEVEERLADALWSVDRDRAKQLAVDARAHYLEAGADAYAEAIARIDARLASKR